MYLEYIHIICYIVYQVGYRVIGVGGDCTEPSPVYYAYRSGSGLAEGSWFNYTCYQNYYHAYGDLQRQCQNKTFTGEPPICSDDLALYKKVTSSPERTGNVEWTVDGDKTTCDTSPSLLSLATTVSWQVDIVKPKAVHRIELIWTSLDGFLLSSIDSKVENQDCAQKVTSDTATNTVVITCSVYIMATTVKITINGLNLLTSLELCQFSVYGAETTSPCGNPPFIYLAEIQGYPDPHTAKYGCIDHLQYRGLGVIATCQNDGHWSNPTILCLDDGSKLLPLLGGKHANTTDGDYNTCSIHEGSSYIAYADYFRQIEVTSVVVVIGKNSTWTDVDVGMVKVLSGVTFPTPLPYLCHYNGPDSDTSRTRLFTCPAHGTGIVVLAGHRPGNEPAYLCDVLLSYRLFDKAYECTREEKGIDYKGIINITVTGEPCDRWLDAPADMAVNLSANSNLNVDALENYCRNPFPARARPWCWVANFTDWQYCEVFTCESLCLLKDDGRDYSGTLSTSTHGEHCLPWSDGNERGDIFFPKLFSDGTNEHSYCRNPGSSQSSTWCYTQPPGTKTLRPSSCNVPACPKGFSSLTIFSADKELNISMSQCVHLDTNDHLTAVHEYMVAFQYTTMATYCYNSPIINRTFTCHNGTSWFRVYLICNDEVNFTTTVAVSTTISTEVVTSSSNTMLTTGSASSSDNTFYTTENRRTTSSSPNDGKTPVHLTSDSTSVDKGSSASMPTNSPTSNSGNPYMTTTDRNSIWTTATDGKMSTDSTPGATNTTTCDCICISTLQNKSDEDIMAEVESLVTDLLVDQRKLSATYRKYNSIDDDRPSVVYVGSSAIIILCIVIILIIFPDILDLFRFLLTKKTNTD